MINFLRTLGEMIVFAGCLVLATRLHDAFVGGLDGGFDRVLRAVAILILALFFASGILGAIALLMTLVGGI